MDLVGHQGSRLPAHGRGVRMVAVVAAALTGFGGAAAVDALAGPGLPIAVADGFGAGDGLTRYVVTGAAGDATPEFLADLDQQDGVDSAQRLYDGTALVATDGISVQTLRSLPGVADVELSPSIPALGTVSDPYAAQYGWNLENTGTNVYQQVATADADVDVTDGWSASTGEGVVIALTDTGFDSDHPDLAGSLWTNPSCTEDADGDGLTGDCHGWNFSANSPDVDNGANGTHGASVAGVLAARAGNGIGSAGVAPKATIMPLVIGSGDSVDANLGAQAIRYAVDHGATIINASWGGQFTGSALTNLQSAIAYAASKGVLIVAAAGNDALDRDSSMFYPASLPDDNLVVVGSSNAEDGVSASSAYGATSVDLFAPGNKVATTWNDGSYRLVSGTSIAAPHVAAALALYRTTMPTATAAELKAALLADVDPITAFQGKSVTGGRLTLSHLAPETSVGYRFTSMTAPAGQATPLVRATGPDLAGTYEMVLSLGMEHGGEVWALSGEDVTVAGATLTTDDAGQVTVPLGALTTVEGLEVAPSVDLAPGRYALSAQLIVDGQPFGDTFAAPLLVGATPAPAPDSGTTPGTGPGTTDPGTDGSTDPGTSTPGTTVPGTTDPGTPGPGTADPGTSGPGTSDPDTTGPGTDDPGTTGPGTTDPDPTDPDTTDPDTTGPGTTDPAEPETSDPGPNPGPAEPGTSDPGTDPGTTDPGTPVPGSDTGSSVDPAPGDTTPPPSVVTYPEVGPFGLTSISPAVVSTAGGTRVTVTGTNVPNGARVRIGDTREATVVSADNTSVVFTAPELVAGVYDVFVFGPSGTESSVLADGLTYVEEPTSDGGTDSAPGTDDGTAPDAGSTPDTGGGSSVVTAVGPNGERLVRSAAFGRLGSSFWSLDCSTSCRGVLL
ncbi:S8 family serine peptidase [Modestobacter sp. VKM Ac-2984]|uniref:S8 family serine peptidase n=1 Tax=Modestobacter sp. VKM Ac-2984 TaxID=3004138 RepID=UPI0022AA2517|nr:S8 family serine peptidase [Modestobacter sp. VKM Ac-2984]MCZ2815788.1 S8 family serine peptidase [Modestobacter sp. VKM Ac-2984]